MVQSSPISIGSTSPLNTAIGQIETRGPTVTWPSRHAVECTNADGWIEGECGKTVSFGLEDATRGPGVAAEYYPLQRSEATPLGVDVRSRARPRAPLNWIRSSASPVRCATCRGKVFSHV